MAYIGGKRRFMAYWAAQYQRDSDDCIANCVPETASTRRSYAPACWWLTALAMAWSHP